MGMTRREMWVLAVGLGLVVVGGGLGVAGRRVGMGAEVVRWVGVVGLGVWCGMRRKLAPWIFVAMVAGAEVGFDAPRFAVELRVFSDIFLRLIKTIVAPLILATLITGIAGHGDLKSVGRMGVKALVYFEVVTTLALVIGLVAINLTKAGVGLVVAGRGPTRLERTGAPGVARQVRLRRRRGGMTFLLHVFPENLAKSRCGRADSAGGGVCGVVWDCAGDVGEAKRAPVLRLDGEPERGDVSVYECGDVLRAGGSGGGDGVHGGAHGARGAGESGQAAADAVWGAGGVWGAGAVAGGAAVRVPVRRFLQAVAEPATIAFATSTSEAALPRAMEAMEALGVPRRVVSFVIPAGY